MNRIGSFIKDVILTRTQGSHTRVCSCWYRASSGRQRGRTWAFRHAVEKHIVALACSPGRFSRPCGSLLSKIRTFSLFFSINYLTSLPLFHACFFAFFTSGRKQGSTKLRNRPKLLFDFFIVNLILQNSWLNSFSLSWQFNTAIFKLSFRLGQWI